MPIDVCNCNWQKPYALRSLETIVEREEKVHCRSLLDEVGNISNVYTHSEVAIGQGLNGESIVQITRCWGVNAEEPAVNV